VAVTEKLASVPTLLVRLWGWAVIEGGTLIVRMPSALVTLPKRLVIRTE
jgi:hypothetical protein